jgi:ankyrin repeat protein
MARKHRIRSLLFFLTVLLFLSAFGAGMTLRAMRQERLDQALAAAIKETDPLQVKALLVQGANPNIRIRYDFPWEQLPVNHSLWQILVDLFRRKQTVEGDPAVYFAIAWANRGSCLGTLINPPQAAIVKALVEAGADPNATTEEGRTVLMLAARAYESSEDANPLSDHPTLQFLIAHGADVNAKTRDGSSAKTAAESRMDSEVIEILRRAGAK